MNNTSTLPEEIFFSYCTVIKTYVVSAVKNIQFNVAHKGGKIEEQAPEGVR